MALVIEDGSIVAGANSYVSVSDFTTFLDDRGLEFSGAGPDEEQCLTIAMDYLETRSYLGYRVDDAQELSFPRSGIYIDGVLVADDAIHKDLKLAQMEVAYAVDQGNNPLSTLGRETKKEKVGDIEVEYFDKAKESSDLRAVEARLSRFTKTGRDNTVALMRV